MPRLLPSLFQLLVPFVVIALSGPLAALAGITTAIAFTALYIRVTLVQLEMSLVVIQSWLVALVTPRQTEPSAATKHYNAQNELRKAHPHTPPTGYGFVSTFSAQPHTSNARPRSSKSVGSSSIASLHSDSYTSLLMTTAPADRDYEGVGGWRNLNTGSGGDSEDENENNTWSSLNSRLELPTVASSPSLAALVQGGNASRDSMQSSTAAVAATGETGCSSGIGAGMSQARRNHVRSLTGGASTYALKMSPVLGRSPVMARSPAASMMRDHSAAEGYFSNTSAHGAPSTRRSSIGLSMSGFFGGDKKAKSVHGEG